MRKKHLIFTFLYMAIYIICSFTFQHHEQLRLYVNVAFLPVLGAIVSLIWLFRGPRPAESKHNYFWLLLGSGSLCFAAAQIFWFSLILTNGTVPILNGADYLWLLQYFFYAAAMLYRCLLAKDVKFIRHLFQIAIFMTIAVSLGMHFVIGPALQSSSGSEIAFFVSLAYPLLDLLLLFAAVSLGILTKNSAGKKSMALIFLGFLLQIMADSAHILLLYAHHYVPGGVIDPLWVLPLLLNGLAAMQARRVSADAAAATKDPMECKSYYTVSYISALLLLLLAVFDSNQTQINSLDIGIVIVTALILLRQIFTMHDNKKLFIKLKAKNHEIGLSEERYRHLIEISPNAICIFVDGRIAFVNTYGLELYGAACREELIGKSVFALIPEAYHETIRARRMKAFVLNSVIERFEYPVRRLDGKLIYIESSISPINYQGSSAFMSVAQDVTGRKQNEEKITYMAYYDPLTGLPNRAKFHEHLEELLDRHEQSGRSIAVLFVDLDRFKLINDSMGHNFGDLFLNQVSERFNQIVYDEGIVYRHGGDEFCIILVGTDRPETTRMAQLIQGGFIHPIMIEGHEYFTSPSIGICMFPEDGNDVDTLIKHADIAMYKAKKSGGNAYRFYSSELEDEQIRRINLERKLRKAVQNNEFIIQYQPKVDLRSSQIIGMEALIRWLHPGTDPIPPHEFIPVAEDSGLIIPIGKWVLQEACRQMAAWRQEGIALGSIAVNISPRQFQDQNLIGTIRKALNDAGLEPRLLEIEITENLMHNKNEASRLLHELKKIGVKISIDDFGTGYSSLSYLKHLPIDCLKIDKSFIEDINKSDKDEAIVKTIIDMGHHMGIHVVAEGIEDERQLRMLKAHNCHMGQGYFFSKPLDITDIVHLFSSSLS